MKPATAISCETTFIALVLVLHFISIVLCGISLSSSAFLGIPFTFLWLSSAWMLLYTLIRGSRQNSTPHDFSLASIFFGADFCLCIIISVAFTIRSGKGSLLCADFRPEPNSCAAALTATSLAWLASAAGGSSSSTGDYGSLRHPTALSGAVVSGMAKSYPARQRPRERFRRHRRMPSRVEIELVTHIERDTGRKEDHWSDIPV